MSNQTIDARSGHVLQAEAGELAPESPSPSKAGVPRRKTWARAVILAIVFGAAIWWATPAPNPSSPRVEALSSAQHDAVIDRLVREDPSVDRAQHDALIDRHLRERDPLGIDPFVRGLVQ
jgi:hypothetical protein